MNGAEMFGLPDWLPADVAYLYQSAGVHRLFKWQNDLLTDERYAPKEVEGNFRPGDNLVYSAPTSAGKSLVAELTALRSLLLQPHSRAIFVLPYVSVAREKYESLKRIWRAAGIRVVGLMGDRSPPEKQWRVAVCTIERAASLLNRMAQKEQSMSMDETLNCNLEEGERAPIMDISCVVVDELHMVLEGQRGHTLESLVAKVLYANQQKNARIQLVGMSATLEDAPRLATWMKAELYETSFRPIALNQFALLSAPTQLFRLPTWEEVESQPLPDELSSLPEDSDKLLGFALEEMIAGGQVLVFCSSKADTENVATRIAKGIFELLRAEGGTTRWASILNRLDGQALRAVADRLKQVTRTLDERLGRTLPRGIAFHHAGLTTEERAILEDAFQQRTICVLVSTSTLAAGVNLPASRVIIKAVASGPVAMTSISYRQMAGRAGRMGHVKAGQSIVLCPRRDLNKVKQILREATANASDLPAPAPKPRLTTKLTLEAIASGLCTSTKELELLHDCLYSPPEQPIEKVLMLLEEARLITRPKETDEAGEEAKVEGTQLGAAALVSSLSPDTALLLFDDLKKAATGLALDTELHMLFLVTPMHSNPVWNGFLNWHRFFDIWNKTDKTTKRVARSVGVSDSWLARQLRDGSGNSHVNSQSREAMLHLRFFSALALFDLINEQPLNDVAFKFGVTRGALQQLQQQSATYSAMVVAFCARLGWEYMRSLLANFAERVQLGKMPAPKESEGAGRKTNSKRVMSVKERRLALWRKKYRAAFRGGFKSASSVVSLAMRSRICQLMSPVKSKRAQHPQRIKTL